MSPESSRARADGPVRSAGGRNAGVDRQGVDAARHQFDQRIIYEPVPGDPAKALETRARDRDAEVAPLARARMADVLIAVVDDFERLRGQPRAQRRFDV